MMRRAAVLAVLAAGMLASACAQQPSSSVDAGTIAALERRIENLEAQLAQQVQGHQAPAGASSAPGKPLGESHAAHVMIGKHVHTDVAKDCLGCHHKGLEDPHCFNCHTTDDEQRDIYHQLCNGCHDEHGVVTTCTTCHPYDLDAPRDHYKRTGDQREVEGAEPIHQHPPPRPGAQQPPPTP